MSYNPENELESVVNLHAILEDARNGRFNNVQEITQEINEIINAVHKTGRLAKEAFLAQSNCECDKFTKSQWSIRKNMAGYYYHFEKQCTNCGKRRTLELAKWINKVDPMPKGYEDAVQAYWNLDI